MSNDCDIEPPIKNHFKIDGLSVSLNTYQTIEKMGLGNLSSRPEIPKAYIKFLLRYIINISRAFYHSHLHNLVHGNFDLSKTVLQRFEYCKRHTHETCEHDDNFFESNECINFFLVNFEPWSVEAKMQAQSQAVSNNTLKVARSEVLQQIKVQDLWNFGNSIIEIMVGKCQDNRDF